MLPSPHPPSTPKRINTHLIRTAMGTDPKLTSIRMIVLIQIQFDTHLSNKPCLNRRSRKPLKAPCHKTNTRPNPHTHTHTHIPKERTVCAMREKGPPWVGGNEGQIKEEEAKKNYKHSKTREEIWARQARKPQTKTASFFRLLRPAAVGWLAGLFLVRRVPPTGIRIGLFCERFYGC